MSSYSVPGTVLGASVTAGKNKEGKIPCHVGLLFYEGERDSKNLKCVRPGDERWLKNTKAGRK